MKYFDPRTILLARHAQHIVLVHFPIALLITSVLFDLLARWTRHRALAAAGAFNLYAAALTAPLAALTGLLAWRWQLEGARLKGALLLHMCFGIAVMLLCASLAWFRLRRPPEPVSPLPWAFHLVGLVGILAVVATAHLGGIVSGVITLGG
jgi:uncharacterized membrane protein